MSDYLDDSDLKALWFFSDKLNFDTLQGAKAVAVIRHDDEKIPAVADLSLRHRGSEDDQFDLEVLAEYEIPYFGQASQVTRLVPRDKVQNWIEVLPEGSPYPFRLRLELSP